MSGMGGRADKRIADTVAYILKCPASTVPQAMRACKFSDKESKNAGKQMAVRRARDKAMAGKKRAFPPNVIDSSTAGNTSMSPLTRRPILVGMLHFRRGMQLLPFLILTTRNGIH